MNLSLFVVVRSVTYIALGIPVHIVLHTVYEFIMAGLANPSSLVIGNP